MSSSAANAAGGRLSAPTSRPCRLTSARSTTRTSTPWPSWRTSSARTKIGRAHECHLTQDALSEKVGKKRSSVSNYLRLLKLPNEVQLALKEGLISMGHAKAIAGAPAEEQLRVLKRCVKKSLSVRQAEELVRTLSEQPAQAAPGTEDEEYPESYSRLVEQLEKFFSQEIAIKRSKNGGGKITIGFADDKDIERFIERFASRS